MEMLWFMWNAAGRPTEGVTMDDINQVRMGILQELPTMDAQAQLLIFNAPKLYAGLRQQWMGASAGSCGDIAQPTASGTSMGAA